MTVHKQIFAAGLLLATSLLSAAPAQSELRTLRLEEPWGWFGDDKSWHVTAEPEILSWQLHAAGDIPAEELKLFRYVGVPLESGDLNRSTPRDFSTLPPWSCHYRFYGDFPQAEFRLYDDAGRAAGWTLEPTRTFAARQIDPQIPDRLYGDCDLTRISIAEFHVPNPGGTRSGVLEVAQLFASGDASSRAPSQAPPRKYPTAQAFFKQVLGGDPATFPTLPRPANARPIQLVLQIPHLNYAIQDSDWPRAQKVIAELQQFLAPLQGDGYEIALSLGPEHDGGVRPDDTEFEAVLEKIARQLESNEQPFYFALGAHMGAQPLERHFPYARKVAEEWAPQFCRGYYIGEGLVDPGNEQNIPFYRALLESARTHRKQVLWHHFVGWWWRFPLQYPEVFAEFTAPCYRDVLVPIYENLDTFNQYASQEAAFGLWYSGRSAAWGTSLQNWAWTGNMLDFGEIQKMPEDVLLRTYVEAPLGGATILQFEGFDQIYNFDAALNIHAGIQYPAFAAFIQLLQKNYLFAPPAEALANVNPIALRLESRPGTTFGPESLLELRNWDRSSRLRRLEPDNLGRVFYAIDYASDDLLHRTDLGRLAILPPGSAPHFAITRVIPTDGNQLQMADHWQSPLTAMPELKKLWTAGEAAFPVRTRNCMASVTLLAPKKWRITLWDWHYRVAQTPVNATLEVPAGSILRDCVTGEVLSATSTDTYSVLIPAGGVRFLNAEVSP